MSVKTLLCEGETGSIDMKIIKRLVQTKWNIVPSGSKYGMGTAILTLRKERKDEQAIYGIIDGDFVEKYETPQEIPKKWTSKDEKIHFGWRWERKEIENYLIDPQIVERVFPNISMEEYRSALEKARDKVAMYQSARTTLVSFRNKAHPLKSHLDRTDTISGYNETEYEDAVCKTIQDYYEPICSFSKEDIKTTFRKYCQECKQGERRHNYYLYFFSGKDIMKALSSWIQEKLNMDKRVFIETILEKIEAEEKVHSWLPEWRELHTALNTT